MFDHNLNCESFLGTIGSIVLLLSFENNYQFIDSYELKRLTFVYLRAYNFNLLFILKYMVIYYRYRYIF